MRVRPTGAACFSRNHDAPGMGFYPLIGNGKPDPAIELSCPVPSSAALISSQVAAYLRKLSVMSITAVSGRV